MLKSKKVSHVIVTGAAAIVHASSAMEIGCRQFDPCQYHAGKNRLNIPGDTTIHTALDAILYGVKNLYWGEVEDLCSLNRAEKIAMKRAHIHTLVSRESLFQIKQKCLILYADNGMALASAQLLMRLIEDNDKRCQLSEKLRKAATPEQDKERIAKELARLGPNMYSHYLVGKLLSYPEDDIRYFYETYSGEQRPDFTLDKCRAIDFLSHNAKLSDYLFNL